MLGLTVAQLASSSFARSQAANIHSRVKASLASEWDLQRQYAGAEGKNRTHLGPALVPGLTIRISDAKQSN